jgi:hypothetical protein
VAPICRLDLGLGILGACFLRVALTLLRTLTVWIQAACLALYLPVK